MRDVLIKEAGWPGHHILSPRCMFHRCTIVKCCDDTILVSTVGEFIPNYLERKEMDTVGSERYYETMAFRATEDKEFKGYYYGGQEIDFEAKRFIGKINIPETSVAANEMHEAVVNEIVGKLYRGIKP